LQNYGSLKAVEEVTGLSGIEGVTMRRYASEMEPAQIEKDYAAGKIPKKYYEGYKKIQKTTPSGNTGAWVMEKNINFVKKNIGFDAAMGVGVYQGSMREAGTVFNMDMSKGASAVKKTNESSILSVVSGIIKQYKAYLGQGDGDAAKQYLSQTFEDIKMDLAAAGREADIGKMSGYLEQIKDGRLVAPSNQDIFSPPSGGSNAKMNFGAKGSRAERHNNPLSLPWSPKRQAFLARKGISFTKGDAFTDDPTKYSGFFQTQEDGNLGAQYVMRNGPNAFNWYKKNHPHAKKIKEIMEKRGVFNRLDIDVGSDEMIKMTEEISRYENKGSTVKNRSRADTVNYDSRDYVRRENQSPLLDAVNKVGDNTSGEPLFTITSPWGD